VAAWACLALAFARATVVVSKLAFFAIPDILLEQGPVREYSFPRSSSSASARERRSSRRRRQSRNRADPQRL
jgi:hypothetical protein